MELLNRIQLCLKTWKIWNPKRKIRKWNIILGRGIRLSTSRKKNSCFTTGKKKVHLLSIKDDACFRNSGNLWYLSAKETDCTFRDFGKVCTFPRLKRTGCFLKKVGKVVYLSCERKVGGLTYCKFRKGRGFYFMRGEFLVNPTKN